MNKNRYVTRGDVQARGWTIKLIEKILGEPDRLGPPRKMYGRTIQRFEYDSRRVVSAEASTVFLAAMKRRDAMRRAWAACALERAREWPELKEPGQVHIRNIDGASGWVNFVRSYAKRDGSLGWQHLGYNLTEGRFAKSHEYEMFLAHGGDRDALAEKVLAYAAEFAS